MRVEAIYSSKIHLPSGGTMTSNTKHEEQDGPAQTERNVNARLVWDARGPVHASLISYVAIFEYSSITEI